jgi:SulP family sulfate permease
MAYALVAGVPPEMGLLAAAVPAVVAALFGSSPYLVTGPTNPIALVIGVSVVAPAVAAGAGLPLGTVLATGLLAGLMLVGFGLFGLGRASRFLSDSVVAGFAAGAGILIALRQVPSLAEAGVHFTAGDPLVPRLWWLLQDAARALASADARALALAAGVPVVVVLLRRVDPRIPGALLALALATELAELLGWDAEPAALRTLGRISFEPMRLHLPTALDPGTAAAPALAIALLATVQSVAAARSLAPARGPRLDPDREVFGQGMANLAAALVGALPTSGSLTRSALARAAGARSRLAPALSGLVILALLPLLAPILTRIPLAALAGLVIFSGLDLINPRGLRRAAVTRGDALVLLATLAATLWIDLVQAIYLGLFLSLALLVRRTGRLHMVEIVRANGGRFREIEIDDTTGTSPAVLLHLEGDLNFAVAPELDEQLIKIGKRGPQVVVLRLKRARHLDATVLEVMRRAFGELRRRGATVILCGLTDATAALLEDTELGRELGPEGLLRTGPRLFEGFERALQRTRGLLPTLPEEKIFRSEPPDGWAYEI